MSPTPSASQSTTELDGYRSRPRCWAWSSTKSPKESVRSSVWDSHSKRTSAPLVGSIHPTFAPLENLGCEGFDS